MKPKVLHKEAMEYSFKAKQALENGDLKASVKFYKQAATLESEVADFYLDKEDLEPTRSILIRSAAFLNLKAGEFQVAEKFIYKGLLSISDQVVKEELEGALEMMLEFKKNKSVNEHNYSYLAILREKSLHYTLEPYSEKFGGSVSLNMLKVFSENYMKSLKSYALIKAKNLLNLEEDLKNKLKKEIDTLVNPLITNSSYGSFKFSIANDFLKRDNTDDSKLDYIKNNVLKDYHNEIFINSLEESEINKFLEVYTEDELNDIFRPLSIIKSRSSEFKVGYFDQDNFSKKYVPIILNIQKKKLLTTKIASVEEIGNIVSSIVHKRTSETGKVTQKTISIEEYKKYEKDIKLKEIQLKNNRPLLLTEDILVNMIFDADIGFTFSFDDFNVTFTSNDYAKAFEGFQDALYKKIKDVIHRKDNLTGREISMFKYINELVADTNALD